VEGLCKRERNRTVRATPFVEAFRTFREGFLALLSQFSEDARSAGLGGVLPLARRAHEADFIDYTISLNGYPLVIVSTTEAMPLDAMKDDLVCRIFVYQHDHPEATPLVDICFHERPNNRLAASAQWFTTEGPAPLGSAPSFAAEAAATAGKEIAGNLLGLMYRFERSWREKPTLEAIRIDRTAARPIGFRSDHSSA
jgi:hypothetical protein